MRNVLQAISGDQLLSVLVVAHIANISVNTSYFGVEYDASVEYFKELHTIDPYMLENIDTYSNILYIQVMQRFFLLSKEP